MKYEIIERFTTAGGKNLRKKSFVGSRPDCPIAEGWGDILTLHEKNQDEDLVRDRNSGYRVRVQREIEAENGNPAKAEERETFAAFKVLLAEARAGNTGTQEFLTKRGVKWQREEEK